jgi:membrane associated rhomboid family serine protease
MIPLYDSIPGRRFPVVNTALIIANFAVFLFYELPDKDAIGQASYFPCDITNACHLGLPWAISWITSMFMHAGWFHILGNMLFLLIFGNNVEDAFGRRGYLAFYLAGGLAATISQTAVTLLFGTTADAREANLGASGAIAAVLGAYIVLYPKSRIFGLIGWIPFRVPAWFCLGLWFVLQLFAGSVARVHPDTTGGGGVAFFAHIGGFVFGVVVVLILARARPNYLRPDEQAQVRPPRWHDNRPPTRASTASALAARTPSTTPAWSSAANAPQKSTKIKCIKCGHVQMEPLNEATFVCEACGEKLRRKTQSATG